MDTLTIEEKPKTVVKHAIQLEVQEERQVIVHCFMPCEAGDGVRIWRSTFLVAEDNTRSKLLYWEGISTAPEWTWALEKGMFRFTLIFSGLPADCKVFTLMEDIPQAGGFHVTGIKRNKQDVYKVRVG